MADTSVKSTQDVVAFLKEQHNRIKELFSETINAPDKDKRERAFFELRSLLAVHETAEEMIVHPKARHEIDSGEAIVDARLHEENQAKQQLQKIESLNIDSNEFRNALIALQRDVVNHAEHEESEEFDKLAGKLSEDELKKMAGAVRAAEAIAPTRPHPGVESPMANLAAGPFVSLLDRARDAIAGAVR
ncbi:hemerythrin domain-containing protein [Mycobacterium sp.]|uniref:hemerythrin domain-containing protein n=1 Tax=Mycobacterium sp. TaxID=1785 RepID=UPI002C3C1230|nr:hemerythrin domain-containing protein [Mycobacterium sp.]HME50385.1 hemerythrin domain-containing protein [Mycobacterium sp.]